jgi:hypothetical protein
MSRAVTLDLGALSKKASVLQHVLEGRVRDAVDELERDIKRVAATFALNAANKTFPSRYGFKLAKDAITWELRDLYATGGNVFEEMKKAGEHALASSFYAAFKSQNFTEAQRILRSSRTNYSSTPVGRLNPALHDQNRNKKTGKISVNQPKQIVPTEDLKAYTAVAIKRLGKTASGWMACAEQLGENGNEIKWKGTAIHGSDGGSVVMTKSDFGFQLTLTNLRPLAKKHISPGQVASIKRHAQRYLQDLMVKGAITKIKRKPRKKAA